MRGIMSDTLSVHISAFNSEIYQEEIAKLFPELKLSISNGRDTHDRLYDCDILIGFGVGLNNEVFDRNKNLKFVLIILVEFRHLFLAVFTPRPNFSVVVGIINEESKLR